MCVPIWPNLEKKMQFLQNYMNTFYLLLCSQTNSNMITNRCLTLLEVFIQENILDNQKLK